MKKYFSLIKNYGLNKLFLAGLSEIKRKIWREFIKGSYSQDYEDLIVVNLFDKKYVGTYLEIGAYHPKRLSNTFRFYKKGWRGTVVEPNPEVKNIFIKSRPEDKFINAGISDSNCNMKYYEFLIPALNTFSKVEADKNIKNGHCLNNIIEVPTKTIDEVLNSSIDFLSIDTEGFDEIILKNWNWKKYHPKVICVEDGRKKVFNLLEKQKYILYKKTKNNSVFIDKKFSNKY